MKENNIATIRKQQGYTQEHLASVCGINIRTIQRLEAGKEASLETLRLVSEALNTPISDLFESIDELKDRDKILELDANRIDQRRKRKTEKHLIYDLPRVFFVLLMLVALYLISTVGDNTVLFIIFCILWIIAWPLMFSLFMYWRNFILEPNWDKKYPLSVDHKK